ncbi:MAG: tetratricopeptide repeat protein, partial [Candidatus Micrarchaeota archaeon]
MGSKDEEKEEEKEDAGEEEEEEEGGFKFTPPTSPTDARTYYHRGNEAYEKGDFDEAIENYNMAIVLNPNFSEAYFNRGLAYYNKKDFDRAIEDYDKAAEVDPKNAVIYNNRGDAYYRKQNFDRAIVDYDKAIALNKRYLKAFYNRGLAYACQQDYERAIEDFNKVVELNPNFAEAYHIRGLAYDYMQNYDKAIADYDKAIELNPNFTEAINHRELAKTKKEQGPSAGGEGGGGMATAGGPSEGGINPVKLLSKPKMSFADVAGMEKLKEELNDAIVYPMMKPELARKYGKLGGGGILLYGPPGCGKTYIIKAAAGEVKCAFINTKISDVMDMYVGNTEKNIHNIFETARKNTPCLVFVDEVEGLGGRRDQMQQQPYQKLAVNQILYEMDGVEANNENVLVVGATNSPWDMDPALRRSGRFGKAIYVPTPDKKSRIDIFKLHCRNKPLAGGIRFGRLARATQGYASADIKQICEDAAAIPWKEAFRSGKERKVEMRDFLNAIKKKKSSLPPWYEAANKAIGQKEERYVIDGKEHKKVTESTMGPGEREAFKELLDNIK